MVLVLNYKSVGCSGQKKKKCNVLILFHPPMIISDCKKVSSCVPQRFKVCSNTQVRGGCIGRIHIINKTLQKVFVLFLSWICCASNAGPGCYLHYLELA